MAVAFTGSGGIGPGGLFTRLGHLVSMLGTTNNYRGVVIPGKIAALVADLATGDAVDAATLEASLAGLQSGSATFLTSLQTLASSIVVNMVNADTPQVDVTFATAMATLIAQMNAASATVQRNTVGATVTPGLSNIGNPVVVTSLLSSSGLPLQNCFPETIVGVCSSDSQSGTATAFREPIAFKGMVAAPSTVDWRYPAGSGTSSNIACVDAGLSQAGGAANFLNNGNFPTFTTPNLPDGWHASTGAPGTQILQSSSAYDGSYAVQMAGDGSTLTTLYQAFGSDTTLKLKASFTYAFCLWAKVDVAPAAGVLRVALVDGFSAITLDAATNPNSVTRSLTTLGAVYTPVFGVFRTPRALPATLRLQIGLSTGLSAGSNLFIDRVAFAPLSQLYLGGPGLAVFSANTPLVVGDTFSVAVTNARNGLLQSGFDALLPMRSNDLILPSAATLPTIADSLVV